MKRDINARSGLLGWMEYVLRSDSQLASGLSIYPGDPREVQEGAPRISTATSAECLDPGCDGNESVYDDILLDYKIAHEKIETFGITSAKFSRDHTGELSELDYTLFPTFVQGYVLNNRVWAKLDLDVLTTISSTQSKFDTLRIPNSPHKEALTALVGVCSSNSLSQITLDIIPGKGSGIIILLHGRPGVGKTATAEAMAADLNRPLYPITYADLGDGPSAIETNLRKIFRYGQRWNCVLLLDEADVFLMPRDIEDTTRNGIVSIFLRNLESYPGIIFLTTNRLDRFDDGVLDRVHLKLRYPSLSEAFTEQIFSDHFDKINQSLLPADGKTTGGNTAMLRPCQVKEKEKKKIKKWRRVQYLKATGDNKNDGWWNGRQIRNNFQLAIGFAEQEMSNNKEDVALLKLHHFEEVRKLNEGYETDLAHARRKGNDASDEESTNVPHFEDVRKLNEDYEVDLAHVREKGNDAGNEESTNG